MLYVPPYDHHSVGSRENVPSKVPVTGSVKRQNAPVEPNIGSDIKCSLSGSMGVGELYGPDILIGVSFGPLINKKGIGL